ncbi:MAG TPA: HAMP domain-containing sensor histidine kinase [Candidatus Acidoferrum sp.]|jgi:signal transduction histidine kinase
MMKHGQTLAIASTDPGGPNRSTYVVCSAFGGVVVALSLSAAYLLPKSYLLIVFGDGIQIILIATATILAIQNVRRSHSHVRGFWLFVTLGCFMWLASLCLWSAYEMVLRRAVPDIPVADILLFLKLVPLTAALALEPHKGHDSRFRAFGLLDVAILILYSLYLYAFSVFAYRVVPGEIELYNFHFNVADAIGNQIFALVAAVALFRAYGPWRGLYRVYFLAAALYCIASDIANEAIDRGLYYTGSLYDVPLTASLAAVACMIWIGRSVPQDAPALPTDSGEPEPPRRLAFLSSHLAMLVTLSTPVIGLWLLRHGFSSSPIFVFRLEITLVTIFLLTLLLSIKQLLLTATLIGTLQRLSDTYSSISRFMDRLTQNEKLASLGELVAQVAKQIKNAMAVIRELVVRVTSPPDTEPPIRSMAGKIGQYAQRTDDLVENMLRFAQETPLQLAPLEVRPLIESALHLSRIAKRPHIFVAVEQEVSTPLVHGDSSQLLHVFLQIISNAIDALEEAGGGGLKISLRPSDQGLRIDFADSGNGISEPERVFEPFYTTKAVGKGTGLGLSTCYGILQQHGGQISCANRANGGALFTVIVPAVPAETATVQAPSAGIVIEGAS